MKRLLNILLLLVTSILLAISTLLPATKRSTGTGNWGTATSWTPVGIPAITDSVVIRAGHTITVDISGNCYVLTDSGALSMTVNNTLIISGDLTVVSGSTFTCSAGTVTMSGTSKTITNPGVATALEFYALDITGTITTTSNFRISSDLSVSISGSLTATNGKVTFIGKTVLSGTANLNDVGFGNSQDTLQLGANSELGIAGILTPTGELDVTSTTPNTVHYNNTTGNPGVKAITYDNLTFSNAGTKTASGGIIVNGNLTINSGATFNAFTYAHAVGDNWTNNGGFTASSSTIILDGTSPQTVSGTTTFNNLTISTSGGFVDTISGAVTVSSIFTLGTNTLYVGSSGSLTLSGAVSGTGTINSSSAGTVSYSQPTIGQAVLQGNYGNLTFSNANKTLPASTVGISGTFTPGTAPGHTIPTTDTINFNGSGSQTIPGFLYQVLRSSSTGARVLSSVANDTIKVAVTFIAGSNSYTSTGSTVDYNGSGDQIIAGISYNNLRLSNIGKKTFRSDTTGIAGNLTVAGTATGNATDSSSTIDYNGTGAQTVGTINYYNLTLSGSGGKTMPSGAMTLNGSFTMGGTASTTALGAMTMAGSFTLGSGTSFDAGTALSHAVGGNWTNNGGTYTPNTGTITFTGNTSAINGTAATQTFNNIIVNKTGGQTLSIGGSTIKLAVNGTFTETTGNFTAPDTMTVGGAVTLTLGTFTAGTTLSVSGNWTNNGGTFTPSTGTITFTGSSSAINGIAVTQTFNNIVVNKTAGQTLSVGGSTTTLILNGTFTETAGIFTAPVTMTVRGDFTKNGGTFTAGTGTVTMNGTAAQVIGGSSATSFNNLTISNTSATVSDTTNFNITTTMTVNANAVFSPGATVVINTGGAVGTITGLGTIKVTRTAATADYLNQYKFTTNTLTNLTVDYAGTGAQTINALNYNNLTISGARGGATVTLASGTVGVASAFTVTATNVKYDTTGNTIDYNGTSAQTVTSSFIYNNLSFSNAGTKNIFSNTTATGNITINSGAPLTLAIGKTLAVKGNFRNGGSFTNNGSVTIGP